MFPECPEHCKTAGTLSEYSRNIACRLGSSHVLGDSAHMMKKVYPQRSAYFSQLSCIRLFCSVNLIFFIVHSYGKVAACQTFVSYESPVLSHIFGISNIQHPKIYFLLAWFPLSFAEALHDMCWSDESYPPYFWIIYIYIYIHNSIFEGGITWRRHIDSWMIRKRMNKSHTTRVSLPTF